MTQNAVLSRREVPEMYTWNAPSVFPSREAWESEFTAAMANIPAFGAFQGRLAEGPATLLEAMTAFEALYRRIGKLYLYASMEHAVDMNDSWAAAADGRSQGLMGHAMATIAFLNPELLAIGEETLRAWIEQEPRLAFMEHFIHDLFRQQKHVRSAEVEALLGMLMDPFGGAETAAGMLTNADFQFEPAIADDGSQIPVMQGTLGKILGGADREARRTAWEHYADLYLAHKNTLAATLTTSLKQNAFMMRARNYDSTLQAALFAHDIPEAVFHNLINTFRKNLPTWHRYWALRRKALGVETLQPYDIWAPLQKTPLAPIPYERAVDLICEGLAPMGTEYVETVRRGCTQQRWVDVLPNQGKRAGAFSSGWPGTYPFIMLSYNNDLSSLSTLAHELGHSMHSYLTWQNQPVIYSDYSMFVAEVASNFHQALVRDHLLRTQTDPAFQIGLIEEAMSNFHRYFFIMPTLARFELETHQRVERGDGLTADDMIALMADLFTEGYGNEMAVDRDRVGITWATFGHLFVDYYVFQYATGISGAHALARGVLDHGAPAVGRYTQFLKSGSALYPLDALKLAGVDLTTPEAVEVTFGILADMVTRLEQLLS
ncbi:MAG: oligoendopeptidase F [Anaerolineae bacterium]|nr:oligoendopeptidase F [Anaerolineae bacterium]